MADLSPREIEVLASLARGRSNKETATALGVSVKTINAHRANIMRNLKLRTYSDLVKFAVRSGIIEG
jgi:DNA-binding CsgD family transcriptional regulator